MCCMRLAENTRRKTDAKNRQKGQSAHYFTNSLDYIFATKAYIDKRKNLLKSNIISSPRMLTIWRTSAH